MPAPTVGVHVAQLRRYEAGTNQPIHDPDERTSIRALIESALLRHQARRLSTS